MSYLIGVKDKLDKLLLEWHVHKLFTSDNVVVL